MSIVISTLEAQQYSIIMNITVHKWHAGHKAKDRDQPGSAEVLDGLYYEVSQCD